MRAHQEKVSEGLLKNVRLFRCGVPLKKINGIYGIRVEIAAVATFLPKEHGEFFSGGIWSRTERAANCQLDSSTPLRSGRNDKRARWAPLPKNGHLPIGCQAGGNSQWHGARKKMGQQCHCEGAVDDCGNLNRHVGAFSTAPQAPRCHSCKNRNPFSRMASLNRPYILLTRLFI
jgi:hypothetical protein